MVTIKDTRYEKPIAEFIAKVADADDETKDSIFYLCGKYDFDETRPEAVEIIADLLFYRGSRLSTYAKYPYTPDKNIEELAVPSNGVYFNPKGNEEFLPSHISKRILRRKEIEASRKKSGDPIYIPNIDKPATWEDGTFKDFAQYAQFKAVLLSEHPDPFGDLHEKPVYSPEEKKYGAEEHWMIKSWRNTGTGTKIFYILAILWLILEIATW